MKKQLILIGGGGHCRSCIDVIEQEGKYEIFGILDHAEKLGERILGYPIIGTDETIRTFAKEGFSFLITLGQITTAQPRVQLFSHLQSLHADLATVISPHAYVSRYASIGEGSIIMHHALINTNVNIAQNCIINSKALIEHDAYIAEHCHISTAAVINGATTIGAETFFGSAATAQEGATIPKKSFIKAASLVKKAR